MGSIRNGPLYVSDRDRLLKLMSSSERAGRAGTNTFVSIPDGLVQHHEHVDSRYQRHDNAIGASELQVLYAFVTVAAAVDG